MAERALVLGGTGHIGSAVVRALAHRGWHVRVLSRQSSPTRNLLGLDVEFQTVRWGMAAAIESALDDCGLLIDAAGPYVPHAHAIGSPARERLLCDAAARTAAIVRAATKHDVRMGYISSFATLPPLPDPLPQRSWMRAANRQLHPYFQLKTQLEEQLRAAAARGLRVTIVNPTICLGPWDGRPRELCYVAAIARGEMPFVVDQVVNFIDVRDVAAALVLAIDRGVIGEPMLLAGHNYRWRELHAMIASLSGAARTPIEVPIAPAWALGYWAEALLLGAGKQPAVPSVVAALLLEHQAREPSALQRSLGLSLHPAKTTLEDAFRWYRELNYC